MFWTKSFILTKKTGRKTIEKINKTHVVNYKTRFSALFSNWSWMSERLWRECFSYLFFSNPISGWKMENFIPFFIIQFYVCLLGNLVLVQCDMHASPKWYMFKVRMYHVPSAGVNFECVFGHEMNSRFQWIFLAFRREFKWENFDIPCTLYGYSSTKCLQFQC